VVLVGHTDASGGLAGNTALSRARAASVRDRLMAEYAVPAAQITAEGVGYLAPRATNKTEDGRARNRRVEAILTSTR
jgi:OOP family OmpA-OmpF porin